MVMGISMDDIIHYALH